MEYFLRMNVIYLVFYIILERGISIEIYYYEIKNFLLLVIVISTDFYFKFEVFLKMGSMELSRDLCFNIICFFKFIFIRCTFLLVYIIVLTRIFRDFVGDRSVLEGRRRYVRRE